MTDAQISKWGNSLAVRLPRGVVREAKLAEGDRVLLDVTAEGEILIRAGRPKYSLQELVFGITAKNRHHEAEWGQPVGKEVW
jgi:antitoxin MazE